MRTYDRLEALKSFLHKHLCAGREMKTPGADYTITSMTKQEPRCYIAYYPAMPDESGLITEAADAGPQHSDSAQRGQAQRGGGKAV